MFNCNKISTLLLFINAVTVKFVCIIGNVHFVAVRRVGPDLKNRIL